MYASNQKLPELKTYRISCSWNYRCAKAGLEIMGDSVNLNDQTYYNCFEHKPNSCQFSESIGSSQFCKCPMREHSYNKIATALSAANA